MEVNYVGKLQEMMVKYGIKPVYEVVEDCSGTHINTFKIRLICRVPPGGPNCTVYGEGLSKKIAKQKAASTFMQNYLKDDNENSSQLKSRQQSPCIVNVNQLNRPVLLQMICNKNDLEKPDYVDVAEAGPSHAPKFTVACKVGHLRTEGEGQKKNDAKLEAATKMIQMLMEVQDIYEIFETVQQKQFTNSNEIVCLINGLTESRLPNPISIFGRRRSSSTSPQKSPEIIIEKKSAGNVAALSAAGPKSPPCTSQKVLLNLMRSADEVAKSAKTLNNSISNFTTTELEDDLEGKFALVRVKSRPLDNLLDCESTGDDEKSSTVSDNSSMNLSRLQAMAKIDRALENAENQLYNEILDTLEQRDKKVVKRVTILSNEFDVFINHGSRAKISDIISECTDESIRIACLTKVLLDLKEHLKTTLKPLDEPRKLDRSFISL